MEIALKFLVENPEGMKSLGDPHACRWDDNIVTN
jgi:hypothetical protein